MNLRDCCKFQEGYVNPPQSNPAYFDGEIKWLRSLDLNDGFVSETSRTLTKAGFESAGKSAYMFPANSLAISKSGSIGKLGILLDEMCGNRAVINIQVDEKIANLRYVFYLLKYKYAEILGKAVGSIQKNLYVSELETLELNHTDKKQQDRIASVLSALDDKIALNKKMNQKLETMAKRLYDYWFVQFDFPDENGRPYKTSGGPMTYNETLKREIPEGWEVKPLEQFLNCNEHSLTAKSVCEYIQYLDTSSLTENNLDFLQKFSTLAECPSRAKRIIYPNDILYSTVRPQQKHYGIIKNPVQNMIASTGFAVLSCKKGSKYNEIFYLFLVQEENLNKLSAIADSNASSYPSFNPSDLLNLNISLPKNFNIMDSAVKKFSNLFSAIEQNQKECKKLTVLREKLLPLLMNGQITVG